MAKSRQSMEGRGPSQRQLRVAELVRHQLSTIFARGEFDEKLLNRAALTVTEVRISPDLRKATAFVMPLGGENVPRILALLQGYAPELRAEIGRSMTMKYTPDIVFKADESFDRAQYMDALLGSDAVRRDTEGQE